MTRRTTVTTPRPPATLENVRLVDLLNTCREATGITKLFAMRVLRDYMKNQDESIVVDEVGTITDVDDLNLLIGAGAPGRIYYVVLGQRARLDGLM